MFKNDKQCLSKTIIALPLLANNHYGNAIKFLGSRKTIIAVIAAQAAIQSF